MKIRILVPCFNEEDVIESTYHELIKVLSKVDSVYDFDLLFVDDGSSDKTLEILKNKSSLDNRVKYLSFSRNFGKEAAMFAGISKSRDIHALIIIDADLQHPPELIPKMLEQFKAGYEQVIAKRDRKGEGFLRKQLSKLYYKIVNKHVDVEMIDGMGDFRLISNRVVNVIA